MKKTYLIIIGMALTIIIGGFSLAINPETTAEKKGDKVASTQSARAIGRPVSESSVTDKVAEFYKILLQKDSPTFQQEERIFSLPYSGIRSLLLEEQKVPKKTPVLLDLFRQHRDLFVPKNWNKNMESIKFTSPFNITRDIVKKKEFKQHPENGYVMALFTHDYKSDKPRFRTVIFKMVDGKIDPDGIYFDGFGGEVSLVKFFEPMRKKRSDKKAKAL